MPHHTESRILPYAPDHLFDLVADVEHYPDFLPWCLSARVVESSDTVMKADIDVGYKAMRETFSSTVTLQRPHVIETVSHSRALSNLLSRWEFTPEPNGKCGVRFTIDYTVRVPLLSVLMDAFFDRAFKRMVEAFEARAANVACPYETPKEPRVKSC